MQAGRRAAGQDDTGQRANDGSNTPAGAQGKTQQEARTNKLLAVVEDDDSDTRRIVERVRVPGWTRSVVVPAGGPRTKPNALTYGLSRTDAELITVFDAEDRPDPGQLRRAAAEFEARDDPATGERPLSGQAENIGTSGGSYHDAIARILDPGLLGYLAEQTGRGAADLTDALDTTAGPPAAGSASPARPRLSWSRPARRPARRPPTRPSSASPTAAPP